MDFRTRDLDSTWKNVGAESITQGLKHAHYTDNPITEYPILDTYAELAKQDGLGSPFGQSCYLALFRFARTIRRRPRTTIASGG